MMGKVKAYKRGLWAEYLAALYLIFCGYRILKMRYKTQVGEIDIIALKKHTLVFVEVKSRRNIVDALESVNVRTRKRIEKAARYFLMCDSVYNDFEMRFDVIVFDGGFNFKHLDNAWMIL